MKFKFPLILILLVALLQVSVVNAQKDKPLTRVLFIVDASGSMLESWDGSKRYSIAKSLLIELLDSLSLVAEEQNIQFALRMFGHQYPVPPGDCTDSKLEVGFSKNNQNAIIDKLNSITPKGTTPIAYSLLQCANDFPDCEDCRNIVVLITDGIERCHGDPCAISLSLQKQGIVLKPYIIGIDLRSSHANTMECIGNYFDAKNEKQFRQALETVVADVTNLTAVQINLLDTYGNPTETNVAMSFHDNQSGNIRYTYMHTMGQNSQPDTVHLDVLSVYDLKVHTVPPVYLDTLIVEANKLNVFNVPTPQGSLKINIPGNNPDYSNIKCIISKPALPGTIFVIDSNKEQSLITGLYNLELLTIPRLYFDAVEIKQDVDRLINIAEPGKAIINFRTAAYGSLCLEKGDALLNQYDFVPNQTNYTLYLQPGYYRIIYRDKNKKKTMHSLDYKFRVKSGETYIINL
ncbi:MAG: VWA domain-containing protein [Bacteroidales bacterium]|nr:VWA domain-containing protein [Bacteroidales bacterium]